MHTLDKVIVDFVINHFGRSYYFFRLVEFFADGDNMVKGGVFSIVIWFLWFKFDQERPEKRIQLATTLLSVFVVMVITMGLEFMLPYKPRPLSNPDFLFVNPYKINPNIRKLSSFPSDHAVLFMSLSTGFFFVSRKIGLWATVYTVLFILFPRLYLGYHYPSDLIGGALLGASVTAYFNSSRAIKNLVERKVMPFVQNYPWYFYAILFFTTYEIADLFVGSRNIARFLYEIYKYPTGV